MNEIVARPFYLSETDMHVLRFSLGDESRDVVLSESNGASDLTELFRWILGKMIVGELTVSFQKNPDYTDEMYSCVCEEYVKRLGAEIAQVFQRMRDEGLINV